MKLFRIIALAAVSSALLIGTAASAPAAAPAAKADTSTSHWMSNSKTRASIERETATQEAPNIQVGSDTRAKSQTEALKDARFAITETGLAVTFTAGPHIGGAGTLNGAGVAVLVTCVPVGGRTFIEVVGTSLDPSAAGEARNRVRTIVMGPAS